MRAETAPVLWPPTTQHLQLCLPQDGLQKFLWKEKMKCCIALIENLLNAYGEGNGNPLQYSCRENPMDRGAWRDIVHRVAQSWMRLR